MKSTSAHRTARLAPPEEGRGSAVLPPFFMSWFLQPHNAVLCFLLFKIIYCWIRKKVKSKPLRQPTKQKTMP